MTEEQAQQLIDSMAAVEMAVSMATAIGWQLLDVLCIFLGVLVGIWVIWSTFYRGSPV